MTLEELEYTYQQEVEQFLDAVYPLNMSQEQLLALDFPSSTPRIIANTNRKHRKRFKQAPLMQQLGIVDSKLERRSSVGFYNGRGFGYREIGVKEASRLRKSIELFYIASTKGLPAAVLFKLGQE